MNTMFLHILLCGIIILLGTLVGDNYIKCKEYE